MEAAELLPSTCLKDGGPTSCSYFEGIGELELCDGSRCNQVPLGIVHDSNELRVPVESVDIDSLAI